VLALRLALHYASSMLKVKRDPKPKPAPIATADTASDPLDIEAADNTPLAPLKHRVTTKVRTAIDAMVLEGLDRRHASEYAGMADHSLYCALRLPHVKAYYREQLDVLRESERAKNIHRAVQIRDAADNMPAMQAIKWLEGEPDQSVAGGRGNTTQSPGVTFVIVQGTTAAPMRDVTPKGEE